MGGYVLEENSIIKNPNLLLDDYKGIIIGQSVGAFNLCKDIYLRKRHRQTNKTKHLEGLGLVELLLDVHFKEDQDDLVDLKDLNMDIYLLTDYGAIIYDKGEFYSKGKVFLLKDGKLDKISE